MLLKRIRNISFRKKMTLIFTVVCTFSLCVAGILYYQFAEKEIVDNFRANAESLVGQLENTLDARLEAVNRRAFAALTNDSFTRPLTDYVNSPDMEKEVALSGAAKSWLKDISLAEPLVHSTLLYTDKGSWDDYTRARNWEFEFKNSAFWEVYRNHSAEAIHWMPAMTDEIFKGEDQIIPYVRRFSVGSNEEQAYLIIQLDQQVLLDELTGNSPILGEILITDSGGNYIAGTEDIRHSDLKKLEGMNTNKEDIGYSGDIQYNGEHYLMYKGVVDINDWQVYILKSKAELLDSMGRFRRVVVLLAIVMIGLCLVLVAFFSRQMTSSLQRLAVQMNRMRSGELEARYYYPYKDEVGSLAQSFNYMADQVERSMKKQEEYIAVLKEERNFVEQVQKQKRKAELRALQAQINPHFLYNTLDSIIWMSEAGQNDEVVEMTSALAKLLRQSISNDNEQVELVQEMEYVRNYLTIQKMRYQDKLEYDIAIEPMVSHVQIVKLVLQPIVENAIYHGIKYKESKGNLWIRAYADGKDVCIAVEDDGIGMDDSVLGTIFDEKEKSRKQNGVGVSNVQKRLKLYYGEEYGIIYESRPGEGTRAVIRIPRQGDREHEKMD